MLILDTPFFPLAFFYFYVVCYQGVSLHGRVSCITPDIPLIVFSLVLLLINNIPMSSWGTKCYGSKNVLLTKLTVKSYTMSPVAVLILMMDSSFKGTCP